LDAETGNDRCVYVGLIGPGQRGLRIEIIIRVFRMNFDAVVMLVKRNHLAVAVAASGVTRFSNAVFNVRKVDELLLQHRIGYGHPTRSARRVRVEGEEAFRCHGIFGQILQWLRIILAPAFGWRCALGAFVFF